MNTTFMLMAQFEKALVPLSEVCDEYFGCSYRTAVNKANGGTLPIHVVRLDESNKKSPLLIHVADLASLIDKQRELAKKEWEHVNC
ncbi:pyocin activator PrtN family protein [Colwellia hornerae]|uniref:Pyocin activator protein PrtN n=1 Tax=Colwellia hornerae TaxID=89402 RepID=A0A5C6QFA9_9GAMM|nr:pyocin activator PrtN family protein [Colwellia hornerae]TWX55257.1 pyocin activator protein PrtN [Colwellia hornerae]TWX61257.1 pyocin activator protein PrtN [Colwellia hornerae]TWX67696.1 pyocin activator protein PrtN [Colwellia hornerae]